MLCFFIWNSYFFSWFHNKISFFWVFLIFNISVYFSHRLAFSNTHNLIAIPHDNRNVRLYDITGARVGRLPKSNRQVRNFQMIIMVLMVTCICNGCLDIYSMMFLIIIKQILSVKSELFFFFSRYWKLFDNSIVETQSNVIQESPTFTWDFI